MNTKKIIILFGMVGSCYANPFTHFMKNVGKSFMRQGIVPLRSAFTQPSVTMQPVRKASSSFFSAHNAFSRMSYAPVAGLFQARKYNDGFSKKTVYSSTLLGFFGSVILLQKAVCESADGENKPTAPGVDVQSAHVTDDVMKEADDFIKDNFYYCRDIVSRDGRIDYQRAFEKMVKEGLFLEESTQDASRLSNIQRNLEVILKNRSEININIGLLSDEPFIFDLVHYSSNTRILKTLLADPRIDINRKNSSGKPLIVVATTFGKLKQKKLRMILAQKDLDVNAVDADGYTALHYASSVLGKVELQLLLLEHKSINVNVQNNEGRTPLHCAANHHDEVKVEQLLSHGANPLIRDNKGKMPVDYARNTKVKKALTDAMSKKGVHVEEDPAPEFRLRHDNGTDFQVDEYGVPRGKLKINVGGIQLVYDTGLPVQESSTATQEVSVNLKTPDQLQKEKDAREAQRICEAQKKAAKELEIAQAAAAKAAAELAAKQDAQKKAAEQVARVKAEQEAKIEAEQERLKQEQVAAQQVVFLVKDAEKLRKQEETKAAQELVVKQKAQAEKDRLKAEQETKETQEKAAAAAKAEQRRTEQTVEEAADKKEKELGSDNTVQQKSEVLFALKDDQTVTVTQKDGSVCDVTLKKSVETTDEASTLEK